MDTIIAFLGAHWVLFVVIAILLIFALIGYFVDSNSIEEDKGETMSINNMTNKVEEVETLSTVTETINNNTEDTTETLDTPVQEEVLDTAPQDTPVQEAPVQETSTQEETTEQLIQENNNTESTFQG